MAYEKNEWRKGDTITSDKLNHMEDGIAEGGGSGGGELLVVNAVPRSEGSTFYTFDKTFGEIWEAYKSGRPIVINMGNQHGSLDSINYMFRADEEGSSGYANGYVKFCDASFYVSLNEGPYTEERLFAVYPYADFD